MREHVETVVKAKKVILISLREITYVSSVVLVCINPSTVIRKLVTWPCVG
jgi:hypothetical protein